MPQRIPQKTKDRVQKLYEHGLRVAEIARRTGISPVSVHGLTKLLEQYNPDTGKKFKKLSELTEYRITQMINPETGQPYKSLKEYRAYCIFHKINPKTKEPFASETEYQKYTEKKRQKRKKNKALSKLIKTKLEEMTKSQR